MVASSDRVCIACETKMHLLMSRFCFGNRRDIVYGVVAHCNFVFLMPCIKAGTDVHFSSIIIWNRRAIDAAMATRNYRNYKKEFTQESLNHCVAKCAARSPTRNQQDCQHVKLPRYCQPIPARKFVLPHDPLSSVGWRSWAMDIVQIVLNNFHVYLPYH